MKKSWSSWVLLFVAAVVLMAGGCGGGGGSGSGDSGGEPGTNFTAEDIEAADEIILAAQESVFLENGVSVESLDFNTYIEKTVNALESNSAVSDVTVYSGDSITDSRIDVTFESGLEQVITFYDKGLEADGIKNSLKTRQEFDDEAAVREAISLISNAKYVIPRSLAGSGGLISKNDFRTWLAEQIKALPGMSNTGAVIAAQDINVEFETVSIYSTYVTFWVTVTKGAASAETDRLRATISSPQTYAINVPSSITGGGVTASKATATAGTTITLAITTSSGYALDTISVKNASSSSVTVPLSGSGTIRTFAMPAFAVTEPTPIPTPTPTPHNYQDSGGGGGCSVTALGLCVLALAVAALRRKNDKR
ncbi:hypothetical protein FACS1894187_24970 [Synergistales bacterium]|nr:hypothetical protein FACS1894187_24970 [Synergistales bacterium]